MKIFVVDDNPVQRMVTHDELNAPDNIICEFSGGIALLASIDEAPDLILLDIEMPGMDGIKACRAWRNAGGASTQIIFVSTRDDLETRLAAYDAGGNDYIIKPFGTGELLRKVAVARQNKQSATEGALQTQFATTAAFTAMSALSEMGVTVEFLRATLACQTPVDLGIALCKALGQYGLKGIVQLSRGHELHHYSTDGLCTALEISIISRMANMERIFQFRDRMVINYPCATMLISNLPLDDPDRTGRLRDHLAVLTEGTDMRFAELFKDSERSSQGASVNSIATELGQALQEIILQQDEYRIQSIAVANNHMLELNHALVQLDLSRKQEDSIVQLSQKVIDQIVSLQDYSISINQRLSDVNALLKVLAI